MVTVVAESVTPTALLDVVRLALQRTGATTVELKVPSPTSGVVDLLDNRVVIAGIGRSDLVIDCTAFGIENSAALQAVLSKEGRILVLGPRTPAEIAAFHPHPGLETRVNIAGEILDEAIELKIGDRHGSNLTVRLDGCRVSALRGVVTEPGVVERMPGGLVTIVPANDTVAGELVVMPGDINLSVGEFLRSPVRLVIDADHVCEIDGASGDADMIRTHLESFDDPAAYGIAHIAFGMNHALRPSAENLYDPQLLQREIAQVGAGHLLVGLGSNAVAGRRCRGSLDICMRGVNVVIDDVSVIDNGTLSGPIAPDVYEAAAVSPS